jgi:hypothetical protein
MCHCSKPLTYGIGLDQLGSDMVHQYVGQEPSGRNFNELVLDYNSESTSLSCAFFVIKNFCRYQCNTDKSSHIATDVPNLEYSSKITIFCNTVGICSIHFSPCSVLLYAKCAQN